MKEARVVIPWTNERVIETILFHGSREPIYETRKEVIAWLNQHAGPMKTPWDALPESRNKWTWYDITRQRTGAMQWHLMRPLVVNTHREFVFRDPRVAMLFKLTWG